MKSRNPLRSLRSASRRLFGRKVQPEARALERSEAAIRAWEMAESAPPYDQDLEEPWPEDRRLEIEIDADASAFQRELEKIRQAWQEPPSAL